MFQFNSISLSHDTQVRFAIYLSVVLAFALTSFASAKVRQENFNLIRAQEVAQQEEYAFTQAFATYKALTIKINEYEALGLDVAPILDEKKIVREHITNKRYGYVESSAAATTKLLDALLAKKQAADQAAEEARRIAEEEARLAEIERNKGTIKGIVKDDNGVVINATVSVVSSKTVIQKGTTDSNGAYEFRVSPGKYTLQIARTGYTLQQKFNVMVNAQEVVAIEVSLTKVLASVDASKNDATANSSYAQKTVATSRGSFLADIMTFNLASGGIKVVTDIVSDSECVQDCSVASLGSLVNRHGGFAGINGTYFCPADYPECANESGSFFWKVYNSRLGRWINQNNGLGEQDPTLGFTGSGTAQYFSSWSEAISSGLRISAGINSKPALLSSGQVSVNEAVLDDKQRTVKSMRGAIGLKGQTFYSVIVRGATVPDLAYVMYALGLDSALTIDGGGSSAMLYKGRYRIGPGRGIPNALIFIGQ